MRLLVSSVVLAVALSCPAFALANSLCGASSAKPHQITTEAWSGYSCLTKAEAGDRWGGCLTRAKYTKKRGAGCPGAQRCCPSSSYSEVVQPPMEKWEPGQVAVEEEDAELCGVGFVPVLAGLVLILILLYPFVRALLSWWKKPNLVRFPYQEAPMWGSGWEKDEFTGKDCWRAWAGTVEDDGDMGVLTAKLTRAAPDLWRFGLKVTFDHRRIRAQRVRFIIDGKRYQYPVLGDAGMGREKGGYADAVVFCDVKHELVKLLAGAREVRYRVEGKGQETGTISFEALSGFRLMGEQLYGMKRV